MPDFVEGRLHLEKRTRGGEEQADQSENRGANTLAWFARALENRLYRFGAVSPYEVGNLPDDFSAHGLLTEDKTRDADDREQHGCKREERIVCDRGAVARSPIVEPRDERLPE